MKKLIIGSFLICTTLMVKSQVNPAKGDFKLSGGAELALPIGDFGDATSIGFGLSAQADYYLSDKVSLNLNAGFLSYQGKSLDVSGTSVKFPN